jgi:hypothetical protein
MKRGRPEKFFKVKLYGCAGKTEKSLLNPYKAQGNITYRYPYDF